MARSNSNEGLPVAVAMIGGFIATLLVLLAGTSNGTRPWVLLMRAASAFLLLSGFLKLLTAGVIQALAWRKTVAPSTHSGQADEIGDTVQTISSHIRSTATQQEGVR